MEKIDEVQKSTFGEWLSSKMIRGSPRGGKGTKTLLAEKMGIDSATIRRYCKGLEMPIPERVEQILGYFEVPEEERGRLREMVRNSTLSFHFSRSVLGLQIPPEMLEIIVEEKIVVTVAMIATLTSFILSSPVDLSKEGIRLIAQGFFTSIKK